LRELANRGATGRASGGGLSFVEGKDTPHHSSATQSLVGKAQESLCPPCIDSLFPSEHRLTLVDEGLHRFAVIGCGGQADQALGLLIAGGGEVER
jgi:hypothetical protein